jgi:hypothetical protein
LEEEAPLVASVHGASAVLVVRNHTRDLHILSLAFLFVFSAYGAAQNLESTVNKVSASASALSSPSFIYSDLLIVAL